MNLPVEDEYHCSKRHMALATVIFLLFLFQSPLWCLDTTYITLSNTMTYPRLSIDQCLKKAEDTIRSYTGLVTDIKVCLVLHSDGFTYKLQGFPVWSAAIYRDGEIHIRNPYVLLKKGILESTLSHELFHAVVHQNNLSLPLWFEEGFANYLFPTSLQESNFLREINHSQSFPILDFYSQSYNTVKNLMREKSRKEIQRFFLLCKKLGFSTAFNLFFKKPDSQP